MKEKNNKKASVRGKGKIVKKGDKRKAGGLRNVQK
jgi:hypothetical protein